MMALRLSAMCLATALGAAAVSVAAAAATLQVAQLAVPSPIPGPGVSGLLVQGVYVTAPIVIDGNDIFRVGAPLVSTLSQLPIATRVADVQTALSQLLATSGSGHYAATTYDPQTLRVRVTREGDVALLSAVDGRHTAAFPIVTVTTTDARANGTTDVDALAAQWQAALQRGLVRGLEIRQPANEQRQLVDIKNVAIVLIAASIVAFAILRWLWRRIEKLEVEVTERARTTAAQAPQPEQNAAGAQRRRFLRAALRDLEPAARLRLEAALAEALVWGLGLSWFVAIVWSLSRFAQTTPLAQNITRSAIGVATIVIATGLLNRVLDVAIASATTNWRPWRLTNSDDRARLMLRVPTIAGAISGAKTAVLIFIAVLSIFGQVGVPIGSVITIGGLTAIALSLAAQNFVRDFLNGFLVLLEDQYVVGDYVTINAFSGNVERLTLRMVQLRDAAGDVITIPHSSVTNVVNQSRNWSRVDYRVTIDPAADVDEAVKIVRTEIDVLVDEGQWTAGIEQPLEWIGVDGLSRDAIVVRASIQTAPLRQFELRRRLNERVLAAFRRAGVGLGAPLP